VGHLALALGCTDPYSPVLPGWRRNRLLGSPIERWVLAIRPGQTPQNSILLAWLDTWVQGWMARQHALPGDEREVNDAGH
jgi:hypothetical protein